MPRPIAARRLHEIVESVEAATSVSVEELADRFGVSRETIRRDLKALAAQGRLDVVHGGALKRGVGEPPFAERAKENAAGKAAITSATGDLPSSNANSEISDPQTLFTVPMRAESMAAARSGRPSSISLDRIRPASSAAAFFVKVVAMSRSGARPPSTAALMRSTSV